MRAELANKLHDFVCIDGTIHKFGNMKFDGHSTIMDRDMETGLICVVRRTDNGPIEPAYFATGTTLICGANIDGGLIGDGHMWIPEDLSKKNFKLGDRVKIFGNVEMYKKNDGNIDYGIDVKRTEHC